MHRPRSPDGVTRKAWSASRNFHYEGRIHLSLYDEYRNEQGRRRAKGLTLRCVECGAESEGGEGWKAYLTVDDPVGVYCPECAEREFGDDLGPVPG